MPECSLCEAEYEATVARRRYCSQACQQKAWGRRQISKKDYVDERRARQRVIYNAVQTFLRETKLRLGCIDCGYRGHHVALEFDHLTEKLRDVCKAKSIEWARREIAKCEVVCANCHAIRTFNRMQQQEK